MRRSFVRFLTVLGAAAALAACQEVSGPEEEVDESELTFVEFADNAPPLESDSVVFWAVRGETRVGEMRYATADYVGKCLLFRVPAQALLRHPNGAPVRMGDSVKIKIRIETANRFDFTFIPHGVIFDPDHPAELEVRYLWSNQDYNGDGVVDERDARDAERVRFWHQPQPGSGWKEIPTTRLRDAVEARAAVLGFSRYALAID